MNTVKGTQGYEQGVDAFAQASLNLKFEEVNQEFTPFLPRILSRVLDVGSGVGQNSAALSRLGYQVVSVEPLQAFLDIAKKTHQNLRIQWVHDSLPSLDKVKVRGEGFDFILLDGVWHHLNPSERRTCLQSFFDLLNHNGVCAISLRNGPAGLGKHIFPAGTEELFQYAQELGFQTLLHLENLPSKMNNKPDVIWSKVVLQKSR